MNNLIEIDGKFYHADDDGNPKNIEKILYYK